jgi:hypothetical protein
MRKISALLPSATNSECSPKPRPSGSSDPNARVEIDRTRSSPVPHRRSRPARMMKMRSALSSET